MELKDTKLLLIIILLSGVCFADNMTDYIDYLKNNSIYNYSILSFQGWELPVGFNYTYNNMTLMSNTSLIVSGYGFAYFLTSGNGNNSVACFNDSTLCHLYMISGFSNKVVYNYSNESRVQLNITIYNATDIKFGYLFINGVAIGTVNSSAPAQYIGIITPYNSTHKKIEFNNNKTVYINTSNFNITANGTDPAFHRVDITKSTNQNILTPNTYFYNRLLYIAPPITQTISNYNSLVKCNINLLYTSNILQPDLVYSPYKLPIISATLNASDNVTGATLLYNNTPHFVYSKYYESWFYIPALSCYDTTPITSSVYLIKTNPTTPSGVVNETAQSLFLKNIRGNCSINTLTNTVSCDYLDIFAYATNYTLYVMNYSTPLKRITCKTSANTSAGSLVCGIGNTSNNRIIMTASYDGVEMPFYASDYNKDNDVSKSTPYGFVGVFGGLLIVLTISILLMETHIFSFQMLFFGLLIGVVVLSVLGVMNIFMSFFSILLLVVLLLIYVSKRQ